MNTLTGDISQTLAPNASAIHKQLGFEHFVKNRLMTAAARNKAA